MESDRVRSRRHGRLLSVLLVACVVLSGAGVTYGGFVTVREGERRYAGQVMDRYADEMRWAVNDRVARYSETLMDLAWAVGAEADLNGTTFDHMTSGLNTTRLSGASAVAFVVPAPQDEVAATQARWRARGMPGLTLDPAGTTNQHLFVVLETAFDSGPDTSGLDISQSPEAVLALTSARDSGVLAISPPYRLLRDRAVGVAEQQPAVLLAAPVYGEGSTFAPKVFRGWLVMAVRGNDFFSQTLENVSQGRTRVLLEDSGATIAAVMSGKPAPDLSLRRHPSLTAGQRTWHLHVEPTALLLNDNDRRMSGWVVVMGSALTLLLAALTGVLSGSRNRALAEVDRATAALREDIARRREVEMQLREREQELQHLAFHDPLTGLANRLLFYERIRHAVIAHRGAGQPFAVLFIDLDGFKLVNDRLGHEAGDRLLQETADKLQAVVREGDTVARFGGDEFAVLLNRLGGPADARSTAERIVSHLQHSAGVGGRRVDVTASVGIAVHRDDAEVADLLREADAAMYAAKSAGKSRYVMSGDLVAG